MEAKEGHHPWPETTTCGEGHDNPCLLTPKLAVGGGTSNTARNNSSERAADVPGSNAVT